MQEPEGYRATLHTSLTRVILMGGVPKGPAVMNFMFAVALSFGLKQPWIGIPFGILVHAGLRHLTKMDPHFLDVMRRHFRLPKYFDV